MFDILTKLASIVGEEKPATIKEWGGDPADLKVDPGKPDRDPAEERSELVDSWADSVIDEFEHYRDWRQMTDDQLERLAGIIAADLGAPEEIVHIIISDHADSHRQSRDAFQSMMGGSADELTKGLTIRKSTVEGQHDTDWVSGALQKVGNLAKREKLLPTGHLKQVTGHKQAKDATADSIRDPNIVHFYDRRAVKSSESQGSQGDVGGAHGEETISPIHGENMEHDLTMESLRVLSGMNKAIAECGIPTAMVGGSHAPASINITAASGSELTGMLKDIMNLAGVKSTEPEHKPIDVLASPAEVDHIPGRPDMAALIRAVDEPEMTKDSMNDELEVEGMPEKTENRPWDSSPHEKERQDGVRKFGDMNSGDHRERQAGLARAKPTVESIAASLFAEYEKFMSEESTQLDELSPRTLSNYSAKAKGQASWAKGVAAHGSISGTAAAKPYEKLAAKRQAGAAKADQRTGDNADAQTYNWAKNGGYGDKTNPAIKEEVTADDLETLVQQYKAGEISYEELKDRLDSLEYTDQSMRQGEMGMYDGDTPAGHRAWDREKDEWDDYDQDYEDDFDDVEEFESMYESKKPSAGLSNKEKSSVVKKAKAGKDIGKPGKGFAKVEKAAKAGGAKDPKAVAAAAMWKGQAAKKK